MLGGQRGMKAPALGTVENRGDIPPIEKLILRDVSVPHAGKLSCQPIIRTSS